MDRRIVRGLIAGGAAVSLAAVTAVIGVLEASDLAAGVTIVTLLVLLALILFHDSWEPADAPGDAPQTDPERVADAGSPAA